MMILQDDKELFPPYHGGYLVRLDAVERTLSWRTP